MFKILSNLLKKEETVITPTVSIGSKWTLKHYAKDPWNKKYIEIVDVKSGWVRYKLDPNKHVSAFQNDQRKEVKSFLELYVPYQGD